MFTYEKNQIFCHFRGGYAYLRGYFYCFCQMLLTRTKQVSTRQNVPDRPIPAEQCTTAGPTSSSRLSKNSQRIPKEFSKNSQKILKIPQKISKSSKQFPKKFWLVLVGRNKKRTKNSDVFYAPLSLEIKNSFDIKLTRTKQVSTRQNVPDRPIPAEQCTTAGPTSSSRLPLSRTACKNSRKLSGLWGMQKSGQFV